MEGAKGLSDKENHHKPQVAIDPWGPVAANKHMDEMSTELLQVIALAFHFHCCWKTQTMTV